MRNSFDEIASSTAKTILLASVCWWARIGAEVGTVPHDVGVAVFDAVADGLLKERTGLRCHLGFDGVRIIELFELLQARGDNDAVGAFADDGGKDLELKEVGLARGGKCEVVDGIKEGDE